MYVLSVSLLDNINSDRGDEDSGGSDLADNGISIDLSDGNQGSGSGVDGGDFSGGHFCLIIFSSP